MLNKRCQQKNYGAKCQTQINIKSLPPSGETESTLWGVYFPCLFFTEYNILKLCHFFEAQSVRLFKLPRHRHSLTFFGVFFSRKKKATTVARIKHGFHDGTGRSNCKRDLSQPRPAPAAPEHVWMSSRRAGKGAACAPQLTPWLFNENLGLPPGNFMPLNWIRQSF